MSDNMAMARMTVPEICNKGRVDILETAKLVDAARRHPIFSCDEPSLGQHSEMMANLTLAYRHLEDARMRLGKVLQAQDGGTSVYDKKL